MLDTLELELKVVVSCLTQVLNQTQVLWTCRKHPQLLGHLSSPALTPSDGHSPSKPFEIKALYRHQWDDISCQTVTPKK